jgi:hypothetical protein
VSDPSVGRYLHLTYSGSFRSSLEGWGESKSEFIINRENF